MQAIIKMRLYLSNPATHTILLKPVKSNIAEAHGQIASLLQVGQGCSLLSSFFLSVTLANMLRQFCP